MWLDRATGAAGGSGDRTHAHAHWDARAIALAQGTIVRAATAAAARAGVRGGLTVAQARAKCAGLTLLPWDEALIARESARASAAFLVASPLVTPVRESPGTWWVGADGFDDIGGERLLATTLLALARAWHPHACVAVADSCVTAQAATWSLAASRRDGDAPGPVHVPPGEDRDYLARVPIALLPMDAELRETLGALGLRRAGAFAALDPLEVERRWGVDGLAAWRLARGDDDRRATLWRTDDPRAIRHDLATPSATMEPVLFLVRASLDRLVGTLAREGLAAAAVTITLVLDDGRRAGTAMAGVPPRAITREARPARPLARAAPLFERCRALLDSWVLDTPVTAVEVRIAEAVHSSAEQGDLLAPAWRDPAAAEAALARLRGTLGAGTVVRPVAHDSHAPERAVGWKEVEQAPTATDPLRARRAAQPTGNAAGFLLAARMLERPEPVEVTTDRRGAPLRLFWRGRAVPVTRTQGPERLSGEWWRADPFARDYWRCESEELGQDLLLYRSAEGWRLQGWYD